MGYRRLTMEQTAAVIGWLRGNELRLAKERPSREQVVAEIGKEAGVKVSVVTLRRLAKAAGSLWAPTRKNAGPRPARTQELEGRVGALQVQMGVVEQVVKDICVQLGVPWPEVWRAQAAAK